MALSCPCVRQLFQTKQTCPPKAPQLTQKVKITSAFGSTYNLAAARRQTSRSTGRAGRAYLPASVTCRWPKTPEHRCTGSSKLAGRSAKDPQIRVCDKSPQPFQDVRHETRTSTQPDHGPQADIAK